MPDIEAQQALINEIKTDLKGDITVQKMFAEHGIDLDFIDFVPVTFADLSVSAKTDHGVLLLNNNLLKSEDIEKEVSQYLVHEMTHWLQQVFGEKGTKSADDGEYLDNKFEQEAFQKQIEFISKNDGVPAAEEYLDGLLDHHDISGKERKEKEKVLMSDV